MSKIFAQASNLNIFWPQNESHGNKGKTNVSAFLNADILSSYLVSILLHQFLLKNYIQLKTNISNYLFSQKQIYQSIMIEVNIFWYLYSDIYDYQKYAYSEVCHLQNSQP